MAVAHKEWREENRGFHRDDEDGDERYRRRLSEHQYTIETHFHVIQKSAMVGKVSGTEIRDGYLSFLNSAFRDTAFQFELGSVSTTINSQLYDCTFLDEDRMKTMLFRDTGRNDVLNVYVVSGISEIFRVVA